MFCFGMKGLTVKQVTHHPHTDRLVRGARLLVHIMAVTILDTECRGA